MANCSCDDITLGNTGTPSCVSIGGVTYKLWIQNKYDSAGNRNYIDTTVALDSTYFADLLNAGTSGATITDSAKRIYPTQALKNVESVRAEDITESFNDGSIAPIQQGSKTFSAITIESVSPALLGKYESFECSDIQVYAIDVNGRIGGNNDTTGQLKGLDIESNTWSPKWIDPTDTTVSKIQFDYTYSKAEQDSNLAWIEASETTVATEDLKGIQDVACVISAPTTTGFTATLTGSYGSAVTKNSIKGMLLADFDCNETSPTPGAEPLSSVTESSDGVYDIVYTTPVTSADVLGLDLQKNGFEMTTAVITTP
jgi:hypothetical protein